MANYEQGDSGSSVKQVVLVIVGSIVGFTLLVALIGYLFSGGDASSEADVVVDRTQVEKNIAPVAEVAVESAETSAEQTEKTGEEVVKTSCAACHATGMMESPKIGDAEQWGPRIAQGYDVLVDHAINGIRNMPAKGGNAALSDKEIARAVAHMANQAGANFKEEAVSMDAAPAVEEVEAAVEAAPVEAAKTAEVAVEEAVETAVEAAAPVAAVVAGKTGEEVVNTSCAMCHGTGLMNAPKIGDAGQWEPRIAQGYDVLVSHAINGIRTMPAKGGNAALTDEEVARAVAHMANQAGANFKAE